MAHKASEAGVPCLATSLPIGAAFAAKLAAMARASARRRKTVILASFAGGVLVLLALAQLLLPRIAANRVSARVGRYGSVTSVSVSAWPALKLLWGDADSVHVRARSLSLKPAQVAKLLWEGRGAASLQISAQSLQLGKLRLSDAALSKHGHALSASGLASEAAVRAALPAGFGVTLLSSGGGQVEVRASGGLFGVGASVDAVAFAHEGRLLAHPLGFLIEGLQLTLFSDEHVHVSGVAAVVVSAQPRAYRLALAATLQ